MIFAVREPDADLDGLPELLVQGLREDDARQLLRSVVPWPLDERVAEQIVAETRGNPLALLELPRGLSPAQLAGGFGLPEVLPLPGRIEDSFLRRGRPCLARRGCGWWSRRRSRPEIWRWCGGPSPAWHPGGAAESAAQDGPGRGRRPGAVPAPAGAVGGLPVGLGV